MPSTISCADLAALFDDNAPFALIDVREAGEYNSSHIPGSSLIPRRDLEFLMADSVPFRGLRLSSATTTDAAPNSPPTHSRDSDTPTSRHWREA